jgi:hypothetical protein
MLHVMGAPWLHIRLDLDFDNHRRAGFDRVCS